jgi:hypothetical protein
MTKPRDDYRVMVQKRFEAMPHRDDGPFQTYTLADLMTVEVPRPRQGDRWGPWVYHARSRELWHEDEGYAIDLDRCGSCAGLLDTIFHVSGKAWMTHEAIGHLVEALEDLLKPFEHLCSCGQDRGPFNVKQWLKTPRPQG